MEISTEDWELLWDLADELNRSDGKRPEQHWRRMMWAFLCGELAPQGLLYKWTRSDKPGVETVIISRDEFEMVVRAPRPSAMGWPQSVANWTEEDYQQRVREPYNEYFIRDPKGIRGLAVRRREFERWKKSQAPKRAESESKRLVRNAPPIQEDVNRWLLTRAKNWPLNKPYPNENEDLEAARIELKADVRRGQIREARKSRNLRDGWAKRGPRFSSPNSAA